MNTGHLGKRLETLTVRELVVGGVGALCSALFFFSPTTSQVEANVQERATLTENIGDITSASSYLSGVTGLIRSPNQNQHLEGVAFDDTIYEPPTTEFGRSALDTVNEAFQRMQENDLVGETLEAVEEAQTVEEAIGLVTLAQMDLQDEQREIRQSLAKIPEYKTVETGNKGRRAVLGAGILTLTAAALRVGQRQHLAKYSPRRWRAAERKLKEDSKELFADLDQLLEDSAAIGHLDTDSEA